MRDLPTGTVTFLFTDIEGSTRLVQSLGASGYRELLNQHSDLLRAAVDEQGGTELGTEGDAHFFVFADALAAVTAAAGGQRALAGHGWPPDAQIRVRMGLHTGNPELDGTGYVGVDLNRVARISASGHGGQVLVSGTTQAAVWEGLGSELRLVDLGSHRLKDLAEPERIFQLAGPGLADGFPRIRSIDTRPKSLPAQVTSFVGRATELAAIDELMSRARLVTLTGPGGSGKTRLAIAAGDRLLPRFDDGVFFVPLAPVDDPDRVAATLAGTLGLRESPDRPAIDVLEEHLRDKRTLLITDNFEHVADAATVVSRLLGQAPGLSVLATSRAPLDLYGEQEYAVQPLPVPTTSGDGSAAMNNDCVRLFVERARSVRADFAIDPATLDVVAEICRRVDGLPLAVELAAASVRILTPAELLHRLDQRLAALTPGARDMPERQRTLRATIDWSHELLAADDRRVFARLSVFAGGWTGDAAEAIGGTDLQASVLDHLQSLVAKSLVQRPATADGEGRFTMLETIREYARERLDESGEAKQLRRMHAAYFKGIAEAAEPNLTGPDADQWLGRLAAEVPNLRAALRWAIDAGEAGDLAIGLLTAGALWRFWQVTGALREAADWFGELLSLEASSPVPAARAKALRGAGGIAYWQNDLPRSRQLYEESVALYRGLDDPAGLAGALNDLAYLPMLMGEIDTARQLFGEARDLFRAIGDDWQATLAELNIGQALWFAGDLSHARTALEAALPAIRERGDRFWLTETVTGLGQLEQMSGNYSAARGHYEEALQLALDAGTLPQVAMVLEPISNVDAAEGRYERAVRLWAAAQAIKEKVGGGAPSEMMQTVDPRPAATEALGEEAVARAWNEGQALSQEAAVALATETHENER